MLSDSIACAHPAAALDRVTAGVITRRRDPAVCFAYVWSSLVSPGAARPAGTFQRPLRPPRVTVKGVRPSATSRRLWCVSGCWRSAARSAFSATASELAQPYEDAGQLRTRVLSDSDGVVRRGVGEVEARCVVPDVPQQVILAVVEHVDVVVVVVVDMFPAVVIDVDAVLLWVSLLNTFHD